MKEALEKPYLRGIYSDQFLTSLVCVSKDSTEQCKEILENYIYGIKAYSQDEIQKWLDETGVPLAFELPFFDLTMHFTRLLQYIEKIASNQDDSLEVQEEKEEKVTKNQDISLGDIKQENTITKFDPCSGKKIMQMLFYALQVKNSFRVLLQENYPNWEFVKTCRAIRALWNNICDVIEKKMFNTEGYSNKVRKIIPPSKQANFVKALKNDDSILNGIERLSNSNKDDDGKQKALNFFLNYLQANWKIPLLLQTFEAQKNIIEKSLIPDPEVFERDLSEFL